ncbi:MAG: OB-fold domain-containing protein [Gammaproteobacteria bacterium]|nr:OB-fold domain-containing protein [Gammaproteobacteria bacterium]
MTDAYLNPGLPKPAPAPDGIDRPFWEGVAQEQLKFQRCTSCKRWQWGPEWICHRCHSDDLTFETVEPEGRIYSYERVWHPVHPALKEQGPYIVVLVEFPQADDVRIVGNLLGDPEQHVKIGAKVRAVFEHHQDADPAYSLVQWELAG